MKQSWFHDCIILFIIIIIIIDYFKAFFFTHNLLNVRHQLIITFHFKVKNK